MNKVTIDNYERYINSDDPELRSLAEMYEDEEMDEEYDDFD